MCEGLSDKEKEIAGHYENMTEAEHEWAVKNGLSFSGPGVFYKKSCSPHGNPYKMYRFRSKFCRFSRKKFVSVAFFLVEIHENYGKVCFFP